MTEMTREELIEKVDALQEELEEKKKRIRYLQSLVDYRDGKIEGLKFAIKCNGVSGGEVG